MDKIQDIADEKLVELVRSKDKQLYAEVIKRYQQKLLRYVGYLVYDSEQSADIVQETFINAYTNLQSFNIKKKFSSWIYRIAHNQAISFLRKKKKVNDYKIEKIKSKENLQQDFIDKEMKTQVKKCLNKLPIKYREPLSLFYLEDRSYEEISDILKIPTSTVGTRINRAKQNMKILCQQNKIKP